MKRSTALLLWIFGLIYTFPVFNKYWAPFDEGIIVVAAQRLLAGEIPYRDFFIVMYPPGQIYVLAGLFKLFSCSLIAGRIYAVLVSVAIAVATFFITRKLTKNTLSSIAAYVIMLTSLAPRLGAIPAPIWPGILLALLTLYLFIVYLERPSLLVITATGLMAGVTFFFRHDIGLSVVAAVFISLLLRLFNVKSIKPIILFVLGALMVTLPWVLYFVNMSAGKDLYDSLIAFTFVHAKTATINLPVPCFDLNMIFHKSLYFINVNQFYIPLIAYAWIACLLLSRFFKKRALDARGLGLFALLCFGAITYKEAAVRADPAHLLAMIAPAVIISAYIASDAFSAGFRRRAADILKYAVSIVLIFLFALLVVKNTDKYIKNGFTKVFKKDTIKTGFDKGTIYVPADEQSDILGVIKYIKENSALGERIYIGNTAHWKDDFGGSLIIYYLADRLPSTKYYELLPGLVTDKFVQNETIKSLDSHRVRLLILQDVDVSGIRKQDAPQGSLALDDFIAANYHQVDKMGKFNIYNRAE